MTETTVRSVPQTDLSPDIDRWWSRPFDMFQTNLRQVDATMNVERAADEIQAYGADTWLINGGGILSFYPTDLPFQTRNRYLGDRPSGDLLGDAVDAAHSRGMRLLARMDFSKVTQAIAEEHPEWCFIAPDGTRQIYNGLVSVCPSADYYQEKMFQVIDEVLDRYEVDGFFFNWFGFNELDYSGRYRGVSQNPSSQRGFADFSGGQVLPIGPESANYDLWRQYADGVIKDLVDRVSDHVHVRRPNVCLIRSDATFFEANNEVGRELWHHATGEAVSAFKSHRPTVPVLVNSVAFIDMPYRMAGEQPEHFAHYLLQAMSRGANPSTYIMGSPGDIPYDALPLASSIVTFHRDHRDIYDGLTPCATVGLVRPDKLAQSLDRNIASMQEFRGLYAALQQRHVAFDVVPLEGVADLSADGAIARYQVLIVPDIDAINEETGAALDRFVDAGGALVLSGAGGYREGEHSLKSAPPVTVTGKTVDEESLKGTYVTGQKDTDGIHFERPIVPVFGAHYDIEPSAAAQNHLSYLGQAPFGPPELAYGNRPNGQPGYVSSRYGQGTSVYIPWTIGRSYHHLGLTSLRELFVDLVHSLRSEDDISAELPEQAELTVQRRGNRTIVHVLNFSGARRKSFGPELRIRGGRLRIPGGTGETTVRSLVSGETCRTSLIGGVVEAELPEIGLFDVIVVESAAAVSEPGMERAR